VFKENVKSVIVRRTPAPYGKKITVFHYFREDYRIQEILAIGWKLGSDGQPWYHISVPMRPNGTYGWIPAGTVQLRPTQSKIVVDVGSRTIDVFRRGKHVVHGIVAVGAPGMETPLGHYYVAATFVPYQDPFLGVYALETSAYSKLTEWPGGGVVGIHGTNEPWLLGKAVSHGCIRVANSTASALKRLTPLGTPILILKG
jgi:lipoprotein-anchoring transpeptidase ErfK/SrfK